MLLCFVIFLFSILLMADLAKPLISPFYLFLIFLIFTILSIIFNPGEKPGKEKGQMAEIKWKRKKKWQRAFVLGIFLLLGAWRVAVNTPVINEDHVAFYNAAKNSSWDEKKIVWQGQVVSEPDGRSNYTQLTLGRINFGSKNLRGRILVNAPNYPEIKYGDWVEIKCRLEEPGTIEDFDYGKFLAVKNIYSVCYRPDSIKIIPVCHSDRSEVESRDRGMELNEAEESLDDNKNNLKGSLRSADFSIRQDELKNCASVGMTKTQILKRGAIDLKQNFKEIIDKSMSYPESEILSAMLLGLRREIPEEISDNFSRAGLSHIIAISGLHITIIAGILMFILLGFGLKRKRAFWLSTLGLVGFLFLIGFRPSSIRAGIMGWLAMLALSIGRLNQSLRAFTLAAFILLLFNPLLIWDVGFQLSFLAVLGIIFFKDGIEKILVKIKIPNWINIRTILAMTLAAQIMVLPLIVYCFGTLSLIAPLANILVLPILEIIMIGGLILIFLGAIWLPLGRIVGLGLQLLIGWIEGVASKLTQLNGSYFELGKMEWIWIVLIYSVIAWLIWIWRSKGRRGGDW